MKRDGKIFSQNYSTRLEKCSIAIQGFSHSKECLDLIEKMTEMKISLIVTAKYFQDISTRIQSIYILSEDEDEDPSTPSE